MGSVKEDSINKKILEYVESQLSTDFSIERFDISQLPYFNPDLDQDVDLPYGVKSFREAIENAQGLLVCSPEYVFSMPGILKNAFEWLVSTMVLHEKPTGLITASSSGVLAHDSLQLILKTIGAQIGMNSAILIQSPKTKFDTLGFPTDRVTNDAICGLINEFKLIL